MKKESDYSKKLRDPRWQKKRLEILKRDEFECVMCGDAENELQVHHAIYERDKEPWEVDPAICITVCKSCHSALTNLITDVRKRSLNIEYLIGLMLFDSLVTQQSTRDLTMDFLRSIFQRMLMKQK